MPQFEIVNDPLSSGNAYIDDILENNRKILYRQPEVLTHDEWDLSLALFGNI